MSRGGPGESEFLLLDSYGSWIFPVHLGSLTREANAAALPTSDARAKMHRKAMPAAIHELSVAARTAGPDRNLGAR